MVEKASKLSFDERGYSLTKIKRKIFSEFLEEYVKNNPKYEFRARVVCCIVEDHHGFHNSAPLNISLIMRKVVQNPSKLAGKTLQCYATASFMKHGSTHRDCIQFGLTTAQAIYLRRVGYSMIYE